MIKKEKELSSPFSYEYDYEYSINDPISFWDKVAKQNIYWDKLYSNVYNQDNQIWFENGKLNTCFNILDKHINNGIINDEIAFVHETPLLNQIKKITYKELYEKVCIFSRALKDLGIKKGDIVLVYLPNSIETVISMLSCARIGAVHNVIFGGQLSGHLVEILEQCKPKLVITTNCGYIFETTHNYSNVVKESIIKSNHKVNNVIILNRKEFNQDQDQKDETFLDWDELVLKSQNNPYKEYEILDSNDPLYILFTSGSTSKPKGIIRYNGDHLVILDYLIRNFNGLKQSEVYFTKASMGWVSGVTWSTYGSLLVGLKSIIIEGSFNDNANEFWSLIERNQVNQFMTTPSVIRGLIKQDPNGEIASKYNISSLTKVTLASEKSQPETLNYLENIIIKRPIVVNEFGQSETGILSIGYPSLQFNRLNDSIGKPIPGYQIKVISKDSNNNIMELEPNQIGELVVKLPLPPGCVKKLIGDTDSNIYNQQYINEYPGYFSVGDCGYYDKDGYYYYSSRSNDSISVFGYTINCGVIENELFKHPNINDCCVIGIHDDISFQQPIALLILQDDINNNYNNDLQILKAQLNNILQNQFSICLELKYIIIVKRFPKTRTTKKIKSIINSIFNGKDFTIPQSIEDPSVVDELIEEYNKFKLFINNQK